MHATLKPPSHVAQQSSFNTATGENLLSMAQQPANPLLQEPFFAIPGISPSAPISAQVQQIDQLNTILLREIDANFAKFHQIITSRILPEIKRYAIASEPIRETSQFWRSFFETAAAVRVPIEGDSTVPTSHDYSTTFTSNTHGSQHHADDSYAQSEGSFMFQPPVSSTPLPGRRGTAQSHMQESWEDGTESPFDRLDRKLEEEMRWNESQTDMTSDAPTPSLPSGYSLPDMPTRPGDLSSVGDFSTGTVEPIDLGGLGRAGGGGGDVTPKAKKVSGWKGGITDLRHTPLNAKFGLPKTHQSKQPSASGSSMSSLPKLADLGIDSDDEDDDDFEIKPMMSPPVTMTFHLEPRAQAVLDAARHTPRRPSSLAHATTARYADTHTHAQEEVGKKSGEARLILDDLMEEMQSIEDSPRIPTPEAFKRYSILPDPNSASGSGSENSNAARRLFDQQATRMESRKSLANTSYGSDIVDSHDNGAPPQAYLDDESFDEEDEDSFDSVFRGGQTIRVAQGQSGYGARGDLVDLGDDDSGDLTVSSVGTDMVFGGPQNSQGRPEQEAAGGQRGGAFNLMGPEEMLTYHGGRLEDAAGADEHSSPSHGLAPRRKD